MTQHPWIEDIISAFQALGGKAHLSAVYAYIEKNRSDLSMTWKATVRRTIENHSSDSEAFLGKEDLFYSINGEKDGMWGLRRKGKGQ